MPRKDCRLDKGCFKVRKGSVKELFSRSVCIQRLRVGSARKFR
jgi:hypothetical protein